jgi:hypothetical protein
VPAVELSVRPDDLAAGATALRQAHAVLTSARAEFESAALRLAPRLGVQASETARSTLSAAAQGAELVEDDLATFAQGLTAAASYYAAVDGHALGRLTIHP